MEWIYGLLVFGSVCCVHLVVKYLNYRKRVEPLKKLPCYRPRFLVGNLYDIGCLKPKNRKRFIADIFYFRLGASKILHKEGLYVGWIGPMPVVFLTRARTAEVVLSSKVLIEKSWLYDTMSDFFGAGLVASGGDKWRQDRKMFNPGFRFKVLTEFLEKMNEHSKILLDNLIQKSKGQEWLDPQAYVNKCVLDILLDTWLDYGVDAQKESSEYAELLEKGISLVIKRIYTPWFYSRIYYLFPEGRAYRKLVQYIRSIPDEKIGKKLAERLAKMSKCKNSGAPTKQESLMDNFLPHEMNQKEMKDHVNTFVAAGHHTVGHSLCWLLYLLGQHKDVQSKLHDEVLSVFPDGNVEKVTKEHLLALKYMDRVIKESHRLYTTVPDIMRHISEDTIIGGYHIPAGTQCVISIACIHRDPDVYPEPERFDPDRFLPENCVGRSQYAFIPFAAGPRNCIGQRYADMKTKVILCHIISKLTVRSLDPEDKIIVVPEIISKPMGPLRIVFEPRSSSS